MPRPGWIALLLLALPAAGEDPPRPPNIVVVLTDDAGYSDPGCYGGEIRTPHIDRLAERGLRFRRCYTAGRCSPTRAALLTGHDPHTVGVGDLAHREYESPLPGYRGFLDPAHPTLAELLRAGGYHTLMCGKWHLGGARPRGAIGAFERSAADRARLPTARGFERFFGLLWAQTGKFAPHPGRPYVLGEEDYDTAQHPGGFYAPDALGDFAVEFLREARAADDRPLFLYLAFTSPHPPHEVAPELEARYAETYRAERLADVRRRRLDELQRLGGAPAGWSHNEEPFHALFRSGLLERSADARRELEGKLAKAAAMLEAVDESVGRVVAELERLGELDDTILFVLSDNGAGGAPGEVLNAPFRGSKGTLTEGGLRSHLVVHWPAGLRARGWTNQVAHVFDLLPTCLELAGLAYPEHFRGGPTKAPEGVSLAGVLRGGDTVPRPHLAWGLDGHRAVVEDGRWKWLRDADGTDHLYDLARDGTETRDLATRDPERVARLAEVHAAYAARVGIEPRHVVRAWQQGGRLRNLAGFVLARMGRLERPATRPRAAVELCAMLSLVHVARRLAPPPQGR